MPLKLYCFLKNIPITHVCIFSVVLSYFGEGFSRLIGVESWVVRLEGDTHPRTLVGGRKPVV